MNKNQNKRTTTRVKQESIVLDKATLKSLKVGDFIKVENGTILKIARVTPAYGYFACYLPRGNRFEYQGKELWFNPENGKALGMIDVTEWDMVSVVDTPPKARYNDY